MPNCIPIPEKYPGEGIAIGRYFNDNFGHNQLIHAPDDSRERKMKELIRKRKEPTMVWSHETIYNDYSYYCKLFDDMITQTPCLLRRRELNGKNDFSCGGCSKDTMMNSHHNRLRSLQEQSCTE